MSIDFINNGEFQKIIWLGVNGFLIINDSDKEILMVDPWPSYCEVSVRDSRKVDLLVFWLVRAHGRGYRLVGIVAGHEHFDHIADIPAILYGLREKGVPGNEIPPIFSDLGTYEEILRRYETLYGSVYEEEVMHLREITHNPGASLYYDDETQEEKGKAGEASYPLVAGTELAAIDIGNYSATPYIWDHASTWMTRDVADGVKSGNLQRCTALLLHHKIDHPGDKKLFLVGSGGEMSDDRTGGYVVKTQSPKIETDMLIQAMPHEIIFPWTYRTKLEELVDYQVRNITVNDVIIASHFENFAEVLFGFPGIDDEPGDLEKDENKNRITEYNDCLSSSQNRSIEADYLNRFLIEYGYGFGLTVENDDGGYTVYDDAVLDPPLEQAGFDEEMNIWSNPRFSSFKKLLVVSDNRRFLFPRFLLFKDKYLANPNTREVHLLGEYGSVSFRGHPVYQANRSCQIHRMYLGTKQHFKTLDDAIDAGYDRCAKCFGPELSQW